MAVAKRVPQETERPYNRLILDVIFTFKERTPLVRRLGAIESILSSNMLEKFCKENEVSSKLSLHVPETLISSDYGDLGFEEKNPHTGRRIEVRWYYKSFTCDGFLIENLVSLLKNYEVVSEVVVYEHSIRLV